MQKAVSAGIFVAAMGLLTAATGCGGYSSPTGAGSSTLVSGSTGSPGTSGATITITAAGVSPSSVTVSAGQSVTVVNNDTRPHEIASNPHPTHGSCPSIENGLGTLAAGQTRLTMGFASAGTCGFHDHLDSGNTSFMGTIVIR